MKIFVTGADGFVGQHLGTTLQLHDADVLLGVRRSKGLHNIHKIEMGDIGALGPDFSAKLEGVSAVVHLAGFAHQPQRSEESIQRCFRTNVEGTKRVIDCAIRAGVRKVIFLSSIKANGSSLGKIPVSEGTPDIPADPYGLSKLRAEAAGFDMCAKAGIQFIALRPPLIYGPGVGANFLRLIKLADAGLPLPFKNVHNSRSVCYVGNLISVILGLLSDTRVDSQKFYVSDGVAKSTADLIVSMATFLGREPKLFPLPTFCLESLPRWPILGKIAEKLFSDLVVDSSRLEHYLTWSPPSTTEQGLRRTIDWYRGHRAILDRPILSES